MKKIVRIGTPSDHDRFRRDDIRLMAPSDRVRILLDMQRRFLAWDDSPMLRIATIRQLKGFPSCPADAQS